jgi:hypothetical protein
MDLDGSVGEIAVNVRRRPELDELAGVDPSGDRASNDKAGHVDVSSDARFVADDEHARFTFDGTHTASDFAIDAQIAGKLDGAGNARPSTHQVADGTLGAAPISATEQLYRPCGGCKPPISMRRKRAVEKEVASGEQRES